MTNQDDLFKSQAGQQAADKGSAEAAGEILAAQQAAGPDSSIVVNGQPDSGRESLGPPAGAAAADIAGGGIAEGAVRVVAIPQRRGSTSRLLILLVLLIVLIAAGYFLLSSGLLTGVSSRQAETGPEKHLIPARPVIDKEIEEEILIQQPVAAVTTAAEPVAKKTAVESAPGPVAKKPVAKVAVEETQLFRVLVGPYLTDVAVKKAADQLQQLGFSPQEIRGTGLVSMIRLLEGIYPKTEARARLAVLKKQVKSAFILPTGDKLAVYAGSFYDRERANRQLENLAENNIKVSRIDTDIEMKGRMLIALQADRQTAEQVAGHIAENGLQTQVVRQ